MNITRSALVGAANPVDHGVEVSASAEGGSKSNVRGTVVAALGQRGEDQDPRGQGREHRACRRVEDLEPGPCLARVRQAGRLRRHRFDAECQGRFARSGSDLPACPEGLGEGQLRLGSEAKSSMTNASVTNLVKGVNGRTVTLSYNGGQQKTINIPPSAPVVTFARPRRPT